ncbi:hypothetical protein [Pseudomonas sp. GCEP-101]|uniref:hypothetical protein n=1 Tax=Pseudomonas sp. GCEP-101 TaxID=2974552 RepID=UPI00223B462A|nr:hypothetical protein [Pseudomonas sp. GCEP-101]
MDCRFPIKRRPRRVLEGERVLLPEWMIRKADERYLGIRLVLDRRLFGMGYQQLDSRYFDAMPRDSGVMIRGLVPIEKICPGRILPGDIDLLVIPFEGDELLASRALAIELKAVRASYARQHRSPNSFGLSQASALLSLGFPLVAVAHLIVSDRSPESAWRKVMYTTLLDAETGLVDELREIQVDMLPSDLINRSYGRLRGNCHDQRIGLLSTYIGGQGHWLPLGRSAEYNDEASLDVIHSIAQYYERNAESFFETLRYPPDK